MGDVFSARVAGNIVNDDFLGGLEFASKLARARLIAVLAQVHGREGGKVQVVGAMLDVASGEVRLD